MKWTFEVFSKLPRSKGILLAIGLGIAVVVAIPVVKRAVFGANSKQISQGISPASPANQVAARIGGAATGIPNWEAFDYIHDQYAAANYKVAYDQQQREAMAAAKNSPAEPATDQSSAEDSSESRRAANRQAYFDPFSRPIPLYGPRGGGGGAAQSRANAAANAAVNRYRSQMGGTLGAQGIR